MRLRAHLVRPAAAWCAVALVGAVVGCAPQSPDHSSWRDQAYQSLNQVASSCATATLLLEQLQRHRVFGKYAQIVALNAETNAGQVASKFGAEQPVPSDSDTYQHVTTVMSDANDVLSQVRIAVVRRDVGAYSQLLRELSKASDQLSKAEQQIGGRTG
jgi:hypothetical protein